MRLFLAFGAVSVILACDSPVAAGRQEHPLPIPLLDRIVFDTNRADTLGDVMSIKLDGSDVRALTDTTSGDACPALSPDGNWIAYITKVKNDTTARYVLRNFSLGLMKANGSGKRTIATISFLGSQGCPFWSPASNRVAIVDQISNQAKTSTPWRIRTYSTDGALVTSFDKFNSAIFSFAPRGDTFLASVYEYTPNGGPFNRRVSFLSMTGAETIIVSGGSFISASQSGRLTYSCPGICVSNADGTGAVQLFTGASLQPVFAPDASLIAYVCNTQSIIGICFISPDGVRTGPFATASSRPVWSANSRFVTFVCGANNSDICTLDRSGNGFANLTNTPEAYERNPSFSPLTANASASLTQHSERP